MFKKALGVASLIALIAALVGAGCAKKEVSFKNDVYPILKKNCLSCHSPKGEGYAASGFSVESYETVMKGTKLGPVITSGSSVSSTLVVLLEHKADPSIGMPRREKAAKAVHGIFVMGLEEPMSLPLEQIEVIKTWIDQGAKNN